MTPSAATPADELLAVAEGLARAAAELLREQFQHRSRLDVRRKSSATDLASEADLAAEALIRELLARWRPDDAILAEEGGGDTATAAGGMRWVVDPLDGTTNFLFGIPVWCVSVACEDALGTVAGVVLDPMLGELFAATRDGTTTLGGAPVHAAPPRPLASALVATGFSYDADERRLQGDRLTALLPNVRDVRRMGAAALDLAWVSAGRYDAFVERGLEPWDIAAGLLLARRSGLEVRALPATAHLAAGIAVGRPALLEELLAVGL